jgi:hypothetical protein
MRTKDLLTVLLLGTCGGVSGQAIDSVLVETYHVQSVDGGAPLVTYRIFIDLAPGHELQMVYGDARNELEIATSASFFNDQVNGAAYGHRLRGSALDLSPAALDSWLTIGAASDGHWGVPRQLDPDGSVLHCPPYPDRTQLSTLRAVATAPLCTSDGLIARDSVRDVVEFRMSTAYLDRSSGAVLHTMDGAWAVLGGTPGITDANVVLVGQFTTSGDLRYRLNVQVRTPDKRVVRYVSTQADGPDEVLFPQLRGQVQQPR